MGDLMRLFGPVCEDDEGREFIFVDDDEDEIPMPPQDDGESCFGKLTYRRNH